MTLFPIINMIRVLTFAAIYCSNGKLKQLSDYQQDASNGWAGWSFNVLVKKPLCWSFSTLVKRPMSWGMGQLTGQIQQQEELGDLVMLDLVKVGLILKKNIVICH